MFNLFEQLKCNLESDIVSSMRTFLHPAREDISLPTILYALGDPLRLKIAAQLTISNEVVHCQDFLKCEEMAKSTLSYHFKVLREAGVVRMVPTGRQVVVTLRKEDLEARFPGLLETILHTYFQQAQ